MKKKSKMINLVIADDHILVREGLKKILEADNVSLEVTGEASNANELFEILKKNDPNIVLLDINMPGISGLDALKEIRKNHPKIPVLMLSMHPANRFAVRSLKAGASGYITKSSIPEELAKAINTVVFDKKKYISPEVAEQLAEQVDSNSVQPLHKKLSDREYQVMCLIASGKKINEIAEELSLSTRTVHTYRSRMMDKMNLNSNVDITHYALSYGLIDQAKA